MKNFHERLGNIIRAKREEATLTQEELAHKAGLHRTYVSLLERGRNKPTLWVLHQIATALGTTMADLVKELQEKLDG